MTALLCIWLLIRLPLWILIGSHMRYAGRACQPAGEHDFSAASLVPEAPR